jgi:hypothetical protein
VGTLGVALELTETKVFRDIYYTPPAGPIVAADAAACQLGSDQYFVLGDNSPESVDSREPGFGPAVPAPLLVGKPVLVYHPSRIVRWLGWAFQVPELSRIRYIR